MTTFTNADGALGSAWSNNHIDIKIIYGSLFVWQNPSGKSKHDIDKIENECTVCDLVPVLNDMNEATRQGFVIAPTFNEAISSIVLLRYLLNK